MTASTLGLGANLRFVLRELAARGGSFEVLDRQAGFVAARLGAREERLVDIDGSPTRYVDGMFAAHKPIARTLLAAAGLCVPPGRGFAPDAEDEALLFAQELGFPLVLKPSSGTHGDGVHTHLESLVEVRRAMKALFANRGPTPYLIEKQFVGEEHRLFITRRGAFAAVHRDPAHVVGDGVCTIRKLIYAESDRRTYPTRATSEGPIALDEVAEGFLQKQGLTPESVPKAGGKIYLRGNSNLKTGGSCMDRTDEVHESVLELAARALAVFPGVPVLGIDFMSPDIRAKQTEQSYAIIEVNTCPGIGMHLVPGSGHARDAASAIVDLLFPDDARQPAGPPRRLPPCAVAPLDPI